jgi:hypothetical protein
MSDDWMWAVAICAAPFVILGASECAAMLRRRRDAAVARRPKRRH